MSQTNTLFFSTKKNSNKTATDSIRLAAHNMHDELTLKKSYKLV